MVDTYFVDRDDVSEDMPPYLLVNTSASKVQKVPVEVKALKNAKSRYRPDD